MITQRDLDEIEGRLKEVFITKEDFTGYKSELFNKLDEIAKYTSDTNTEFELVEKRVSQIEETLQTSQ